MRKFFGISVFGAALALMGPLACSALDFGASDAGFGGNFETDGPGPGAGGIGAAANVGGGGANNNSFNYAEFCGGVDALCVPGTGDQAECTPPPLGAGGAGGSGVGGGDGGSAAGGSAAGGSAAGGSAAGGSATGGTGGAGGGPSSGTVDDCRLGVSSLGEAEAMCVQTATDGTAIARGGSCLRADQCDVGMGCVRTGNGDNERCQPYCCAGVEECPTDTYCTLAPIAELDAAGAPNEAPRIPVCVDADDCELGGTDCSDGQVCTVVRLMGGITSCVEPGTGLNGDACPCAEGHFCNTENNECLQLCELNKFGACPDGFNCQGGSVAVPEPWGTCVTTY